MKVGIPKGLLYYKYYPFFNTFFTELGAEIVTSPYTNKEILNMGVNCCIDEACLPVKIFHGHIAYIKDKCDVIFLPRLMSLHENEFICPKFCGLPEMVKNNIRNLPKCIDYPIYAFSQKSLKKWVIKTGMFFTKNYFKIIKAYENALKTQANYKNNLNTISSKFKIALVGHPYNVYDDFVNMNLVEKLNTLNIEVLTDDLIDKNIINNQVKSLFKKPFWTFAKNSYGFSTYVAENKNVQGIIYLSSFACGIDSIVIELIKDKLGGFPFLILKIDEQTGEAGFDTRLEAFTDMLERRYSNI